MCCQFHPHGRCVLPFCPMYWNTQPCMGCTDIPFRGRCQETDMRPLSHHHGLCSDTTQEDFPLCPLIFCRSAGKLPHRLQIALWFCSRFFLLCLCILPLQRVYRIYCYRSSNLRLFRDYIRTRRRQK